MTLPITIDHDTQRAIDKSHPAVLFAQGLELSDDEGYRLAGQGLLQTKDYRKVLEDRHKYHTEDFKAGLKKIDEQFKPSLKQYDKAIEIITDKMTTYKNKKEAETKQLELKAQQDAEKEKKRILDTAQHASPAVKHIVAQQAAMVMPDPVPDAVPKIDGLTFSGRWVTTVRDDAKFLAWCLEEPKERAKYWNVHYGELNKLATAQRDNLNIPGVEVEWKPHARVTG